MSLKSCCTLQDDHIHTSEGVIILHNESDFEAMRKAGRLAAKVLNDIESHIAPGVTTEDLNRLCDDNIRQNNAIPAPLNYRGFPKSICTSVNHVVCHGIPNDKPLKHGDIVNVDVTVILDGWYGDTSRMFVVGSVPPRTQKLLDTTRAALMGAIDLVRPGVRLGDIGHFIETFAQKNGFSVVENYCGHGIGQFFHGPPSVLHFGQKGTGLTLQKGMVFTIEPMLNIGVKHTKVLRDGWTVVTKDKSLSAQYEHTIGVTNDGCEIFTDTQDS